VADDGAFDHLADRFSLVEVEASHGFELKTELLLRAALLLVEERGGRIPWFDDSDDASGRASGRLARR